MAPLVLDGDTLGKKHQHLNQFVRKAVIENLQPEKFNPEDNDVDNLLKIDIASKQRNVKYILEVLQSEDMLYVSRAIKTSQWLWTDSQYSHIINPEYLHSKLFPNMTSKARQKLMLHIRLNLKDEKRVDQFFKYYKEKNPTVAMKWLPKCSLPLIEEEVKNHTIDEIPEEVFKKLCEKSISVLEIVLKNNKQNYYMTNKLKSVMFLLNTNTEKYLDLIGDLESCQWPSFGPKATDIIMKKCPQKVLDNFEKYAVRIDMETFAKNMKKEEIKEFLLKQVVNKDLKHWFCYENLKDIIKFMPKEGKFEFLKKLFIETTSKKEEESIIIPLDEPELLGCSARFSSSGMYNNYYRWYRFAPFEVAFPELKKLIRSESSPTERIAMLAVMLTCAKRNPQHVHTLLQFYHDKHINEPFKFKIQFVNNVLSKTNTWTYDENTWKLLNTIFYSMDVYDENSENNVQLCIESIIVYKVLHNEAVPEVIEKKFKFSTLKKTQRKLNEVEKSKLFDYLYKTEISKLNKKIISTENDFNESLQLMTNLMSLLADWNKDLIDFPLLGQIKDLIKTKKEIGCKTELSSLYNIKKSWRKIMFEESLVLYPCEDSLLNAIKHDPKLLQRHKNELEMLHKNDKVSLNRFLKKLRVYFSQSVYNEWTSDYLERLNKTDGHKSLTRALCILLPQKQLADVIQKYSPPDAKINWGEEDELVLSLRKNFAKNMYLARPLLQPELALNYAKGDYLQFALPTITSVLHDISSNKSREFLPKLLEAPVSVQKHGIRLAFTKLESGELKQIFSDIWKSNKNPTIRAVLFKQTFDLLCKENNNTLIEEIWNLLEMFIDNLTTEENKIIYNVLDLVKKVPVAVRGKYCMKSYKFLKSLPAKANCEGILNDVVSAMKNIMELLDVDFVTEIILDFCKDYTTKRFQHEDILSSFLLCAKDEDSQMQRYEKVLSPLWERALSQWGVKTDDIYIVNINVKNLLHQLRRDFQKHVFIKKMAFPVRLFTTILSVLEKKLPIETAYVTVQTWKLTTAFVRILETHKSVLNTIEVDDTMKIDDWYDPAHDTKWSPVYLESTDEFSKLCVQFLRDDITKYFPAIYILFGDALSTAVSAVEQLVFVNLLKKILENCEDSVEHYLMVLHSLPNYCTINEIMEIRNVIKNHPSIEVKMHFYKTYED